METREKRSARRGGRRRTLGSAARKDRKERAARNLRELLAKLLRVWRKTDRKLLLGRSRATPSIHFANVDHVTRSYSFEQRKRSRSTSQFRVCNGIKANLHSELYVQRTGAPAPLPLCRERRNGKLMLIDDGWNPAIIPREYAKLNSTEHRDVNPRENFHRV